MIPEIKPVYAEGKMVLVPRGTYQFAVVLATLAGIVIGIFIGGSSTYE